MQPQMAPEMLTTKKYSEKVDQYAFAMLLWQMITGKSVAKGYQEPGDDEDEVSPLQIAFKAATHGWRPPIPPTVPAELRQLMQLCWYDLVFFFLKRLIKVDLI